MSKKVREFSKLGLGCAFIGILVLFAFLNHNSSGFWPTNQISWNTIEKTLRNDTSVDGSAQEYAVLMAAWILLMVIGSYLFVHIHFRVLREEKR
ncbi:MAG: hypothetical protein KGH89_05850 [Thaumarchaeota archaeon]|nr:hypothetical protein [Nitrososphaerota archaeon]